MHFLLKQRSRDHLRVMVEAFGNVIGQQMILACRHKRPLLDAIMDDGREQRFLRGIAGVQRAFGNAGGRSDIFHRHAVITQFQEHPGGGGQDSTIDRGDLFRVGSAAFWGECFLGLRGWHDRISDSSHGRKQWPSEINRTTPIEY